MRHSYRVKPRGTVVWHPNVAHLGGTIIMWHSYVAYFIFKSRVYVGQFCGTFMWHISLHNYAAIFSYSTVMWHIYVVK